MLAYQPLFKPMWSNTYKSAPSSCNTVSTSDSKLEQWLRFTFVPMCERMGVH